MRLAVVLTMGFSFAAAAAAAQTPPREPTDIYIRRNAGLPVERPVAQIEITDVGHLPMSKMVNIVANRTAGGWAVTYACAQSPGCAKGQDHLARDYVLSPADSAEVDRTVANLKSEAVGNTPSSPNFIGGFASVAIDFEGFKQRYDCTLSYGPVLGRLDSLLLKPVSEMP
jgi:hypothetical protein